MVMDVDDRGGGVDGACKDADDEEYEEEDDEVLLCEDELCADVFEL